jgi:hypothetical protein
MIVNPTSLISLELLKSARIALLFGIVYWQFPIKLYRLNAQTDFICRCLGFAGVAPPATLTVRAKNLTSEAFIPKLNYSLPSWDVSPGVWEATSVTNRVALQSAFSLDVVPLPPYHE